MNLVKLFVFLFLMCSTLFLYGQHHIPEIGERIVFYPTNKELALEYDCFYSSEKAITNKGYKFEPAGRFCKNEHGMTSLVEIEDNIFYVERKDVFMDGDMKSLVLFLRREKDEIQLLMKVPFCKDMNSNALTNSFVCVDRTLGGFAYISEQNNFGDSKYLLKIPYVNADSLMALKQFYLHKDVIFKSPVKERSLYVDRKGDFNLITKSINVGFDRFENGDTYHCKDIVFGLVNDTDIYQQLYVISKAIDNAKEVKIPIVYHIGNTKFYDRNEGEYFFFSNFFLLKEKYNQLEFQNNGCEDVVEKFKGRFVYYGAKTKYVQNEEYINSYDAYENRIIESNELYTLTEGTYECIDFDILKRYDENYPWKTIFAIMKDSAGVKFKVPAIEIPASGRKYNKNMCKSFGEYFSLPDEADSIINLRLVEEQIKKTQEEDLRKKIISQYGVSYANFLKEYSTKTIERFLILAKKYGKANAKMMIEKHVSVGWSKEMCKESWGEPNDINVTTGNWGTHEQWVYEYIERMQFLYFENGILTAIQD